MASSAYTFTFLSKRPSVKHRQNWKKTTPDSIQWALHDKGRAPKFRNTSKHKGGPALKVSYQMSIKFTLDCWEWRFAMQHAPAGSNDYEANGGAAPSQP